MHPGSSAPRAWAIDRPRGGWPVLGRSLGRLDLADTAAVRADDGGDASLLDVGAATEAAGIRRVVGLGRAAGNVE
jgi:hypothetical protein